MFNLIYSRLKKMFKPIQTERESAHNNSLPSVPVKPRLGDNIDFINRLFVQASDVVLRQFKIPLNKPVDAFMFYIDGLTQNEIINDNLLRALMIDLPSLSYILEADANITTYVKDNFVSVAGVKVLTDMNEVVDRVLEGETALFIDNSEKALVVSVREWESRSVTEPETEVVVRGPRDGFTETIRTNTVLLRRRIKSHRLKFETVRVGDLTRTEVCLSYIDGVVNDKIVEEVRERLSRIKIDGILESGNLEELIEDNPFSVFPQTSFTERPDKVAGGLLEGQVALLVDNTPFVLLVPATFPMFFQATEDYYNRYTWSTFIRFLRFLTINIALLLPSLYVAVLTYHQEMIPTELLVSLATAREGVPFPLFVETIAMEFTFEILREAGIRLPRPIGQAVSIVGALVIGQAAVAAGLVSNPTVIVVALTAISSFTMPSQNAALAIRFLRFPIIVAGAFLGLFGVMVALMLMLFHLVSLRSFGVPYMSPIAPASKRDLKDTIVRVPWWAMFTRPRLIGYKNPQRQKFSQRPGPPKKRETNKR